MARNVARETMERKNLSVSYIARVTGMSKPMVDHLINMKNIAERDKRIFWSRIVSPECAALMARALGISVLELEES